MKEGKESEIYTLNDHFYFSSTPPDVNLSSNIQDNYTLSWEDANVFCQAPLSTQVRQTPGITSSWKGSYTDAGYDCMKSSIETLSRQMATNHVTADHQIHHTQPQQRQMPTAI